MTAVAAGTDGPVTDSDHAELKALLEARSPLARSLSDEETLAAGREYLGVLATGGWMLPAWPRDGGGRGASAAESATIRAIVRKYPAPDLYPFFVGLHMVGPTLLKFGNDRHRESWLRRIADGSDVWCQMFSEPGAGSDLANVSTRATRTDSGWSVSGQKVWTSRGAYADWGLCLTRTDPELPKHAGLTMFAVRMAAPGVTVRPLHQMNGDDHFSEVFLDDVEVSDDARIGDEGDGWKIAHAVLAYERSSIGGTTAGPRQASGRGKADGVRVPGWLRAVADAGQLDDPVRRDAALRVYIDAEVARLTSARAAARARSTGVPGPEGSGQKLRLAGSAQRRAYLLTRLAGADGLLTSHRGYDATVTAPSLSLRGGTDEIQRNIVAERVLGLPAEPRADRDVPWSISRRGMA